MSEFTVFTHFIHTQKNKYCFHLGTFCQETENRYVQYTHHKKGEGVLSQNDYCLKRSKSIHDWGSKVCGLTWENTHNFYGKLLC